MNSAFAISVATPRYSAVPGARERVAEREAEQHGEQGARRERQQRALLREQERRSEREEEHVHIDARCRIMILGCSASHGASLAGSSACEAARLHCRAGRTRPAPAFNARERASAASSRSGPLRLGRCLRSRRRRRCYGFTPAAQRARARRRGSLPRSAQRARSARPRRRDRRAPALRRHAGRPGAGRVCARPAARVRLRGAHRAVPTRSTRRASWRSSCIADGHVYVPRNGAHRARGTPPVGLRLARGRRRERSPRRSIPPSVCRSTPARATATSIAPLVYAHRGLPADFAALRDAGVDVRGAIALIRYGGAFRGLLARNAQDAGAARRDPVRRSRRRRLRERARVSERAVASGVVGAARLARRRDPHPGAAGQRRHRAHAAARAARPERPEGWAGALDAPYPLAKGPALVHLAVAMNRTTTTLWNTVGDAARYAAGAERRARRAPRRVGVRRRRQRRGNRSRCSKRRAGSAISRRAAGGRSARS